MVSLVRIELNHLPVTRGFCAENYLQEGYVDDAGEGRILLNFLVRLRRL